jgi:hypothetical protein
MNVLLSVSHARLPKTWPWLALGCVVVVMTAQIGLRWHENRTEAQDLAALKERLSNAASSRDRLARQLNESAALFAVSSNAGDSALKLRQRLERAGSGYAQLLQLRQTTKSKSESTELTSFAANVRLPETELEKWLHQLEKVEPRLVIDGAEARRDLRPGLASGLVTVSITTRIPTDVAAAAP